MQKAEKILEQARRLVSNQPDYLKRVDYAYYGLKYSQMMIRLLPLYAKLYNSGVKIDFYSISRLPKTTDANAKVKWLEEAKKLGEEREKMLYAEGKHQFVYAE